MNFLTQEMLHMTYPDEYYKNVIEPAKAGKGPVPSKMQMLSKAQPFKAMRIGIDPYLPKSMQTGYDAFRAAPTGAVRTAIGSNIAYGLPFAYASLADALQGRLEDQGLTGKGGIAEVSGLWGAEAAGADVEYDINAPNENQLMAGDFNLDFDEIGNTSLEQLQEYFKDIKPEDLGLPKEKEKPSVDWDIRNRVATGNTIVPGKGIMHAGILPPQILAWMHPKNLAKIWAKQAQTNFALETGSKFVEKIKQEKIKKKQEAEAQAALQARVTAQANREAARRVARGEGRDYGHTETRASSGWERSPFYQGGRVGFSKGGIVDLWQELSNL